MIWKVAVYSGIIFFCTIFSKGSFCLLTVSGQAEFFTLADIFFHPDNIDLLGEQKQFYLCHRVLAWRWWTCLDYIILSFNKSQLASPVVQLPAAEDHPTAQALPLPGFALQFKCVLHGPLHTSFFKDAGQKVPSSKIQVGDKRSGLLHPQVCLHLWRLPALYHGGDI